MEIPNEISKTDITQDEFNLFSHYNNPVSINISTESFTIIKYYEISWIIRKGDSIKTSVFSISRQETNTENKIQSHKFHYPKIFCDVRDRIINNLKLCIGINA
ncbi:hypothetical protein GCM10022393_35840 [Aquimarina addita]|uniref:Uncharacterized protein n=1 Tax=Aquimarina addita TaxID=870485 RepID=A0ABP6UUV3_9FLAO